MQKLAPHLSAAPAAPKTPSPPSAGSPTSSTPNAGVGITKIH
jgi:hypothetical protein